MAQLLLIVFVVLGGIGLLVLRRRTLARMAIRNIVRKKKYTVIITAGLLIATAMISGALVMADTLNYIIKQDTFDSTGAVDLVASAKDFSGEDVYFDMAAAKTVSDLATSGGMTYVDAAAPAIRESAAVLDVRSGLPYPSATIFALNLSWTLNPLLDENRNPVERENISSGQVVINQALADELNAEIGDMITVSSQGRVYPAAISHIAYNTGAARWMNQRIVFVDLQFAQDNIFFTSKINKIDISCMGSVTSGYTVTDQAIEELGATLP